MNKKFVILEGPHGNKFFSPNRENPTHGDLGPNTFKILGYADTVEEAQIFLYGRTYPLHRADCAK